MRNTNLFTSAAVTMATSKEVTVCWATPLSFFDKEILINMIKEHIDVINNKNTKFYTVNKKAMEWLRSFVISGHHKIHQHMRKMWKNIRNGCETLFDTVYDFV